MDDVFVTAVVNVRNALDRRLERAMCKEEYPPQRVTIALRWLRVGRFDKMRLCHLADLEDYYSTTERPLKVVGKSLTPDADIRKSFAKMRRAITVAMPDVSVAAGVWIDKLEDMLTKALEKGVGEYALSRFYRASMLKVSTPVLRYVGGAGRASKPRFDMAFLEEASDARDEFKDAIYERHASGEKPLSGKKRRVLAEESDSGGSESDSDGDYESQPSKKPTKKEQKKAVAAALKAYNVAGGTRMAGVAAGAAVPLPRDKTDASVVAFRAAHPPVKIKGVGNRPVCWNYVHPQGCNKGGDCTFAHEH